MSIYAVNKLCRVALHDPEWREALKRDPKSAIAPLPLSDDERSALLNGAFQPLLRLVRPAEDYVLDRRELQ